MKTAISGVPDISFPNASSGLSPPIVPALDKSTLCVVCPVAPNQLFS